MHACDRVSITSYHVDVVWVSLELGGIVTGHLQNFNSFLSSLN
jgi:hypothetical protein